MSGSFFGDQLRYLHWRLMQQPKGPIQEFVTSLSHSNEQLKANARLIAAAPELLEACKRALPYLASHSEMTLDAGLSDRLVDDFEFIEAAIAKAEGR